MAQIDKLLKIAIDKKASDLHIAVNNPPIIRINGTLYPIKGEKPLTNLQVEKLVSEIISKEQKERFYKTRELDFSYGFDDTRFRVNTCWERGNISLAARIIPAQIPTLQDLRIPDVITKLLELDRGLILLTGPTGCGKSTTLASMINFINQKKPVHIVTLEDPIEFAFKSNKSMIIQRQLGTDMTSFAQALKHVVRQDPNVIMVGEMRDLETISAAVTLAETGHLILATLHTPNTYQTIDRIIDIFPSAQQNQIRMQLSMVLKAVISQILIPSEKYGRVAAREILLNIPAVSNLIRENKVTQIRNVIYTSSKFGMTTFEQSIKELVKDKLISEEEAQAHSTVM